MRLNSVVVATLLLTITSSRVVASEMVNFDDAETGITSGSPDLAAENPSGSVGPVTGSFTDSNGTTQNYTVTGMVGTLVTGYAVGAPNAGLGTSTFNVADNRIEYSASQDRFSFSSGWDSGEGQTGEVRQQMLTVQFDQSYPAADVSASYTSGNTAGEAWESIVVQFLDASGMAIGTHSYDGYWSTVGSTVNPDPISTTGAVWTAEDTSTIDTATDSNNPVATSDGPNDNATVDPVSLGMSGTTLISGWKITRYLEDVATVNGIAGLDTSTNTTFTSGHASGMVAAVIPEPSGFLFMGLVGVVFSGLRRWSHRLCLVA